jgi:hypothetical protein
MVLSEIACNDVTSLVSEVLNKESCMQQLPVCSIGPLKSPMPCADICP